MEVRLDGKIALITGATQGVGAAIAELAARSGAAGLFLTGRDQGKGDKVLSFKRKPRKRYRKTVGHRQLFTEVLVTEIALGSDKSSVDEKAKLRARARIKALAAQKVQNVPLTRAQKVAAAAKGK